MIRRSSYARTAAVAMLFAATAMLWCTSDAAAQRRRRRVIMLEETCGGGGPPGMQPNWLVTAPDRCPGATLLRLCGGAARPTCPTIVEAATALGDDALDRCSADPALLGPAGALYEDLDRDSARRAERVYLAAARAPSIRGVALYRAAHSAYRTSRYDATLQTLGLLLADRPSPVLTRAARDLYAHVLLSEDWNEDYVRDPEFGVARFSAPNLPDAPWAFGVALFTLHAALDWYIDGFLAEAVAEVQRRWPTESAENAAELDTLLADLLERRRDFEQLGPHALAAAVRCREHAGSHPGATSCERAMLGRAVSAVVRLVGGCRGDIVRAQTLDACAAVIAQGRRVVAARPTPSLALDLDDAQRWLEASRVRAALRPRARRGVPAPTDPTRRTELPADDDSLTVVGDLDPNAFRTAVDVEALRACLPARATALGVSIEVAQNGSVTATSDATGITWTCVRPVLERTRAPLPEGGPARFDGLVLFGPASPSSR